MFFGGFTLRKSKYDSAEVRNTKETLKGLIARHAPQAEILAVATILATLVMVTLTPEQAWAGKSR